MSTYQARAEDYLRRRRAGASGEWTEPEPLPSGLPPVAPFDLALIPETLRPWVADISDLMQCPADYIGAAVMAELGSVIGRQVGIRPQRRTEWTVIPNQWALIIGRPGVLKSPAIEAALMPLKRLQALAVEQHKDEMAAYELRAMAAEMRKDAAKKAAKKRLSRDGGADVTDLFDGCSEEEAPALRRYLTNDPTAAALGEVIRQNPNGVLVHRDELVSLLKSLDRDDNAEGRGFYLTGWNGDSAYTFDRITRGLNLHIPAVCLSLLGGTQPGRIAEYVSHAVRGGAGDDGLIQRFGLLVWPDVPASWGNVDRWPDRDAKNAAHQLFADLDTLDPISIGATQDTGIDGSPDGIPYLRFDADAADLFDEWRAPFERELRSGELHPAMESHLSKYRKLVPGLALITHLAGRNVGPVGVESLLTALAWAEYLRTHAARAYASVLSPEIDAAKAILKRIEKGDLKTEFVGWQVWRNNWAGLGDRETVYRALNVLVDAGWLRAEKKETSGRTATSYTVNPRALR